MRKSESWRRSFSLLMPTKKQNKTETLDARQPMMGIGWVSLFVLIGLTILTCAAIGYSGVASASPSNNLAQANTPTTNPLIGIAPGAAAITGTVSAAPSPVSSPQGGAPVAVPSGLPSPLPTGQAPVGGTTGNATGSNAPASSGASGGFPWLIVGLVVLLVLAGLVFAAMRQRRSVTPVMEASARQTRPRAEMPRPSAAERTTVTATGMVTCPNCGTSNAATEKYCRECGQDLRSAVAQSAAVQAATPPADAVAADTPYLETLDRVGEQLEFVLSRQRVTIGADPSNDIVIDAAFKGWQTVSPQHAELRREQDGGFEIVDHDSESGTFVNEMRTGENILSDGDLVRVGDVRFVFHVPKGGGGR